MGQYYRPIVIDTDGNIQVFSSFDFDNGAKLMEHSWVGNELVNAVLSQIHNSKKQVAWIGDYTDEPYAHTQDIYTKVMPYERFMEYYRAAWNTNDRHKVSRNSFSTADMNILNKNTTSMYLINHDSLEYKDIGAYILESGVVDRDSTWCINPLPLLTACGNDRGGGDSYSGNAGYEYVGIWAFATIEYTGAAPEGYTRQSFKFIEDAR